MKQKLLEAPDQLAELPAEPDYDTLPTGILKTMVANARRRIKSIGDESGPEDVADKTFSESLADKAQDVIDKRGEN
jgi:hypothetical protein